ncbi:rhodanese-like domain-containing protein [Lacinutrix sp. C3R15]|uniref:rhodanese-like domain-containing protein n=1 Tax=Flavobacteriaceae TaxID=49546 RepID=UPI001C095976|nr:MULTISPECIES: rhodanese-like domain-containing protein [Flavobacteriaceae]MBU2939687.1 rhodanese-like domain-containing protein [Lacinutrix sp. C3R15]MDO6623002.1 rhodanese-like domain-containing protein [Oceanihabitans sp. 1_MG-2023]
MKRISILLITVLALTSFSCKEKDTTNIKVITTQEMQSLLKMDQVQLVDVRTPKEFKSGYIANAQNIDFLSPTFDQDILKLDKEKPVLLYCHSGGRSAKCAKKLEDAGFTKIYDLQGGISRWKHQGLTVTE